MRSLAHEVARYERWLRSQCDVVEEGLEAKHKRIRKTAFDFLRASYFRWARTIEATCPAFSQGPKVLCVGDIHVENFGTWRDADSREVWGINDFDEAAVMPYSLDLIRLVTSIRLAPQLELAPLKASASVLKGYVSALAAPKPRLLERGDSWFRALVGRLADGSDAFWREIDSCETASPPAVTAKALRLSLPKGAKVLRFATRQKGGGSLGRPRFLAIADWHGGRVVREAKAAVPSAWEWAHSKRVGRSSILKIASGVYRSPDPTLKLVDGYVLRRVAVDSRKLDIEDVVKQGFGVRLLHAMGADLGAIHAAHRRSALILDDLNQRDPHWLNAAANLAEEAIRSDFRDFRVRRE